MQLYFKYDLRFIQLSFKHRWLRPLEYGYKMQKTLKFLFSTRPTLFWIQLPPNFLLHVAWLYKTLFAPTLRVIADCHNATLRAPWVKIPGTIALLKHCDLVIVHNQAVLDQALALGISPDKVQVLEDPPAQITVPEPAASLQLPHPLVVCPCSFNADEPIQAVIEAARLAPDMMVALTGNPARARGLHGLTELPANVKLTGFLSEADFNTLLLEADLILGLTKLDGIQLSVASEAIGLGKPLVLSNTKTLQTLFYQGAVFVDSSQPDSIVQGCRDALANLPSLKAAINDLKTKREQAWKQEANRILDELL